MLVGMCLSGIASAIRGGPLGYERACAGLEAVAGTFGSGLGAVAGSRFMMGRWSTPLLWQTAQVQSEPRGISEMPVPLHLPQDLPSM